MGGLSLQNLWCFFLSFEEKNVQATHAAMHNMENASLVELKDMSH